MFLLTKCPHFLWLCVNNEPSFIKGKGTRTFTFGMEVGADGPFSQPPSGGAPGAGVQGSRVQDEQEGAGQ